MLNPDKPMYLVAVTHPKGSYIPETDLDRTDLVTVCKDLVAGQYKGAFAVLEIDLTKRTCREATDDFKDLIPD